MKTYVKVNGEQYPATIVGRSADTDWDGRKTKTITLYLPFETVSSLFHDGVSWSIIVEDEYSAPETAEDGSLILDYRGQPTIIIKTSTTEYDNSEYYMAGPITDRRDGSVTVKMGIPTDMEKANTTIETLAGYSVSTIGDVTMMRSAIESAMALMTDAETPYLSKAWVVGETVEPGDRRYYAPTGKLYKVRNGQGHTTQADWTPDQTPALWTVIDVEHTGTKDDPIPSSRGMDYIYGKYYSDPEDGNIYLCKRTGEEPGGTINLQYLPHELIGHYFETI